MRRTHDASRHSAGARHERNAADARRTEEWEVRNRQAGQEGETAGGTGSGPGAGGSVSLSVIMPVMTS